MPFQRVLPAVAAFVLFAAAVAAASGAPGPNAVPTPTVTDETTTTDAGTTTVPPTTSTGTESTASTSTSTSTRTTTTTTVSTAVTPPLARRTTKVTTTTTTEAAQRKHKKRKHRKHKPGHEPLKVTPPLALKHYVFPVVGQSDYVDTYGAFRGDVPGRWHHGDDIFAPLGAPVVAVSAGTINRVGWERLGGWRLWVRDPYGDTFYYAHLSGYVASDLRSNRVKAGQVVGFIGNTGDAFTTSPHLHFEIHPRQLQRLHYDGAVDPTKYLNHWRHLRRVNAPRPVHPPLPEQPLLRREATYVFHQLLAARGVIRHAPKLNVRPHIPLPPAVNGLPALAPPVARAGDRIAASHPARALFIALLIGLGSLATVSASLLIPSVRRRVRRLHD